MSLTIDLTGARQRPTNYLNICRNIVDSYPSGIAHGLQKDAIQNGLDAIIGKKPLRFTFEVVETEQGCFFTMTDASTCGLTGPVLKIEDYEEGELGLNDHWARFESFAFEKNNPDAIGARGQGKFVFLAASKQAKMLYDSLRQDGTYRLGFTVATHTGCPMKHWDEDEARVLLKKHTGLGPLTEVGTRIIIVDPIKELLDEIKNGSFEKTIQETWFRAIEKGKAEINIKFDGQNRPVTTPAPFPAPKKDSKLYQTWIRDDVDTIEPEKDQKFRIKHLHIVCKKDGNVPEHLRGVAIIHNNMKITAISMSWAPPEIQESIFGFIEFDRLLDRELRKNTNQNPNHYDLKWRKLVPRAIKNYIEEQLREFGAKKLGIGLDPREKKRRTQNTAEEWAMRHLSRFARDLDLFGTKGPISPPGGDAPLLKERGVVVHDFSFPVLERTPRVNWGETVSGFTVSIFNRTGRPFFANLKVFLLFGDEVILNIDNREKLSIPGKGKLEDFGPYSINFSKKKFSNPGVYKLRVKLIDEKDRTEIDSLTRKIYLEKDPDLRAPFTPNPSPEFPSPYETRQWLSQGALGSDPILNYNTAHPAYRRVEEDEYDLGCYLFEIFLEGSIAFILNRPDPDNETSDFHPLDNKRMQGDPKDAYDELVHKISEIRAKFYEEV